MEFRGTDRSSTAIGFVLVETVAFCFPSCSHLAGDRQQRKYYFEVELFSNVAHPQIGVITTDFQPRHKEGIGNDREGWAFLDGQRQEHLRGGRAMSIWKAGDVLGLAVDFESGIMCLSQNGTWLDDAVYTKQIDAKKKLWLSNGVPRIF